MHHIFITRVLKVRLKSSSRVTQDLTITRQCKPSPLISRPDNNTTTQSIARANNNTTTQTITDHRVGLRSLHVSEVCSYVGAELGAA